MITPPQPETIEAHLRAVLDALSPYDLDDLDLRDLDLIKQVAAWMTPRIMRYFDVDVRGMHHIPDGPCLYVGNHSGGPLIPDTFVLGCALHRDRGVDALPHALVHDFAFRLPGLNQLAARFGGVRGTQDNGMRLLAAGRKLLAYPGGAAEAMRPYADRYRVSFHGHTGFVRLALRAGVPVVPVVTAGSHATLVILDDLPALASLLGVHRWFRIRSWPLSFTIPWGFTVGPPPPYVPLPTSMSMAVLPPIHFDRHGDEAASDEGYVRACAERVERTMQEAMDELRPGTGLRAGLRATWRRWRGTV